MPQKARQRLLDLAAAQGMTLWDDGYSGLWVDGAIPPDGRCPVCQTTLEEGDILDSGDSGLVTYVACPQCDLAWQTGTATLE